MAEDVNELDDVKKSGLRVNDTLSWFIACLLWLAYSEVMVYLLQSR